MTVILRSVIVLLMMIACAGRLSADSARTEVLLSDTIVPMTVSADSAAIADSIAFAKLPWYRQLIVNKFSIHDPAINYPKFPRFLLKVYDWGDKTFNSYDPTYVVGVGKNWKVTGKSYNWMESYMMAFSFKSNEMLHIRSNIYNDVGVYLSFMALSVGYTAKVSDLVGQSSNNRSNLNFNFTCSRIFANLDMMSTNGNSVITHFGDYNNGKNINFKFNDIQHKATSGEAFYIFNYNHYSQAAAYCYSKYQLKSAGSWLLGFSFNHQNIKLDFSSLPQEMKAYLPALSEFYHYKYTDYGLCGGYAHNWVLSPKKWLANITMFPSVGYRHSFYDATTGSRKHMIATAARARFAFVYNHNALFASLTGRIDANIYFNSKYTFFNSIESLSLIVGARF